MATLNDLSALTQEQLIALVIAQRDAASRTQRVVLRVNNKPTKDPKTGATKPPTYSVSLLGLGQFPVTLYAKQWTRLLAEVDSIRAFLDAHADELVWEKGAAPGRKA